MAKAETSVEELVGMIELRECRLPEMQRHNACPLYTIIQSAGFPVSWTLAPYSTKPFSNRSGD